jgi:DNA invertase Pin-like site-specific DNA recombinase
MSSSSSYVPRKIALCYVRLSYTKDESDKDSPERQKANIERICQREGWIPEWYVDAEGHKSGRTVDNRPGWQDLEKRLKDPEVAALIANDSGRMHRKFWRVGYLAEILDECGVRLIFANSGKEIDTSDSMDRMMLNFMAMQDEAYANDIASKAKDSVRYRKSLGKSIGMPPFGTVRGENGYLQPSPYGAWLLPDGHYLPGEVGQEPPQPGALWWGYYDCARRILELFAENKRGKERVAYLASTEGWVFRDRKNQPRAIKKDDVRRVISSWRQYAGLCPDGKAKDVNAGLLDDPVGMLYDTGHSVFSLDLLRKVAEIHASRSVTTRPTGLVKKAHPYPLVRLLYCAQCERLAEEQGNPKYRTRLSGVDQHGKLRYRHAEGVKCGCQRRSVFKHVLEDDFGRLLKLLTIREDARPLMIEIAIQSEHGRIDDDDFETQKQAAIAKCQRRIDNARFLLLEGDLSQEEFIKRKEQNEREIAHWQARTTETYKAAIELTMCMEALDSLARLWDTADDEDRGEMARVLFEYIVYDLDKQQIVDFRLKPWADRYLVLRAALYDEEGGGQDDNGGSGNQSEAKVSSPDGEKKDNRSSLKSTSDFCPIGASATRPYSSNYAMLRAA